MDKVKQKTIEKIRNAIARLSYGVKGKLEAFLLPRQMKHIDFMISEYEKNVKHNIAYYSSFQCIRTENIRDTYFTRL